MRNVNRNNDPIIHVLLESHNIIHHEIVSAVNHIFCDSLDIFHAAFQSNKFYQVPLERSSERYTFHCWYVQMADCCKRLCTTQFKLHKNKQYISLIPPVHRKLSCSSWVELKSFVFILINDEKMSKTSKCWGKNCLKKTENLISFHWYFYDIDEN